MTNLTDLSSILFKDRVVFLTGAIEPFLAEKIIQQLFVLDALKTDDIFLYINSGGGEVISGLAILDCMNSIRSNICTIVQGASYSMACVLASAGAKGKRFITPHSEMMAHTVSSGYYGKDSDIQISAERTSRLNNTLMSILAKNCNRPVEEIVKATEHDKFFTAQEAVEFGLVDDILGVV
jgi:ATP-dependent Clp protease protease subunit